MGLKPKRPRLLLLSKGEAEDEWDERRQRAKNFGKAMGGASDPPEDEPEPDYYSRMAEEE